MKSPHVQHRYFVVISFFPGRGQVGTSMSGRSAMRRLIIAAAALASSSGACGGSRKTVQGGADADADTDTGSDDDTASGSDTDVSSDTDLACIDADGDGHGEGDACRGSDPDDADPCDPDPHVHDCPCNEVEPVICYEGPEGTLGVGICSAGMKGCVDGRWGTCEGQVLPSDEVCDGVDNDCDRSIDGDCTP